MKLYQQFFANKYDAFTESLEIDLSGYRKRLIQPLKGKILDVGSGTGVNFSYFSSEADVIAIEPSKYMLNQAQLKFKALKNIHLLNLGINDDELSDIIAPKSLDFIVCTLVLCTIPNPGLALDNFSKWLKPTGKLILLEHIHSEKKVNRFLQNVINPFWKLAGGGCHLNRDTDLLLKQSGFALESEEYFKRTIRFYAAIYSNKT